MESPSTTTTPSGGPTKKISRLIQFYEVASSPVQSPAANLIGKKRSFTQATQTDKAPAKESPPKRTKIEETQNDAPHVIATEIITPSKPKRENATASTPRTAAPVEPINSASKKNKSAALDKKRMDAAFEVMTSERSYVDTLEQFIKTFLLPLKEGSKSHIITENERNTMFCELETILQLNKMFLAQVENRLRFYTKQTLIADIFLSFMPHFKMYTQFCYNYPAALQMMTTLSETNAKFKSFVRKAETQMQKRFIDVLITPVQRVPRYVLLLDTLIKNTPSDHPDCDQLKKAHELAQNAANDINAKLREAENRSRVLSVQQRFDETLDEDLVQPHRQHMREGVLRKKDGDDDMDCSENSLDDSETAQDEEEKGKLYCFLFNDIFLVAECIGKGANKKLSLDGNFDLATTWVKEDSDATCLQVVNPRSTYVFKCATVAEKELWRDSIIQSIDMLLKLNRQAAERRAQVEVKYDEDSCEWTAEIVSTPVCCARVDNSSEYRELVLESTQRELSRFAEENADKLTKFKLATPAKNKTPNGKSKSVFKRLTETFMTPQKAKEREKALLEKERETQRLAEMERTSVLISSARKRSSTVISRDGMPISFATEAEMMNDIMPSTPGVRERSRSLMDLSAQFAEARTPIKHFECAEEVFAPGSPQVQFINELHQKEVANDGVSVISKQLEFVQRQLSGLRTPKSVSKTMSTKKRRRERSKLEDSKDTSEGGKENAKENKHKRTLTGESPFTKRSSNSESPVCDDKVGGSLRKKDSASKRRQSMVLPKSSRISRDSINQSAHSTPLIANAAAVLSAGTIFGGVESPSKFNSPSRRANRMSLDASQIQKMGIVSPTRAQLLLDTPQKLNF